MRINQSTNVVKKPLILIFTCLITFGTNSLSSNQYLMDPMPNKEKAPDFIMMGMDEKEHTLDGLKGKFVLVNFGLLGVPHVKWKCQHLRQFTKEWITKNLQYLVFMLAQVQKR